MMYIITKIEHDILKSIHDHLADRGIDPVMSPVRIDQLPGNLDPSQLAVAVNAMAVFQYVTTIGKHIALTEKGVEVLKNACLFRLSGPDDEETTHPSGKDPD